MHRLTTKRLLYALPIIAVLLAACAEPLQLEPRGQTVTLTSTDDVDGSVSLAAALYWEESYTEFITQQWVTEIYPGGFIGPLAPIREDRTVTVTLPNAILMTPASFAPAADLIPWFGPVLCELHVSDADALVTQAGFSFFTVPGIVVFDAHGSYLSVVTDAPFTEADYPDNMGDFRYMTWVNASAPVTIRTGDVSSASACHVEESGADLTVDVTLEVGWNQLAWSIEFEPTQEHISALALHNSSAEDLYMYAGLAGTAVLNR
ncbi:MAG: hypothetical protein KF813_09790 [Trueperaceae bacterium]|nr:hypothetical protein [Trueperaceae bacterium]